MSDERDVDVGEVRLRVTLDGPEDGPLVVLLHGFPECRATWRHVTPLLVRAGFRVAAPDMRGYGDSEKPRDVDDYGVRHLASDVAGLVRALGRTKAHVAGHDWGGMAAWATAMHEPAVVDRLAILNAAHPVAFDAAIRGRAQMRRSWYIFLFQLPLLPEWWIAHDDAKNIRDFLSPDGISKDEVDLYVRAMSAPRAPESMIAYYRQAVRGDLTGATPPVKVIAHETLVLWGANDRFLGPELATPPPRWVEHSRVVHIEGGTHWVQVDSAPRVAEELARHFAP